MKAVFDTKPTSIYDDDLSQHYQFPKRYTSVVEQCVDGWVVLRRPRADGGNLAYFATARISHVDADPTMPGMNYARLTNYLEFDEAVPWRLNGRYAEESLRDLPIRSVGVYLRGRSVRLISDADFVGLIASGLRSTLDPQIADRFGLPRAPILEAARATYEAGRKPDGGRVRRVEQALTNRTVRDANFETFGLRGVRQPLCGYRPSNHRCARASRSAGSAHLGGGGRWT